MATIEQRKNSNGSISYRANVRMRGFSPEYASFKRKKDALRWVTQTEAAMLEGRYYKSAERRTVSEAIDDVGYLIHYGVCISDGICATIKNQIGWCIDLCARCDCKGFGYGYL